MRRIWIVLILLAVVLVMSGCDASTISTIKGDVNTFLPTVKTIATLATSLGDPAAVPIVQAAETTVNALTQQLVTVASGVNASNAATAAQKVSSIADSITTNISGIETAAKITNPVHAAALTGFVTLSDDLLNDVVNALPKPTPVTTTNTAGLRTVSYVVTAAQVKVSQAKIQTAVKQYKLRYNALVSKKTGDAKVDAVLAKRSRFVVAGWSGWHPTIH
jgi:hypothetical protein